MKVLEINNLSKSYGKTKALNDLSLTLEKGNIYGLLGPNGSGKTTTLGIIMDVLKANEGNYTWFEGQFDPHPRLNIGAILETPNFYPYLNATDNLKIVQHIKKSPEDDLDSLLKWVNLYDRRKSNFKSFSLGMKQRLAIAASLIGEPEVLIFDEPTNGLDPQGIAEIREIILKIADEGKTILMASHILDEVEKICSHVAILKSGKLLASGPVGTILDDNPILELGVSADKEIDLFNWVNANDDIQFIQKDGNILLLSISSELQPEDINSATFQQGIVLQHLKMRKRTLEEEFLSITQ
jgi:ABC-2 type transport system ATP-binding protein